MYIDSISLKSQPETTKELIHLLACTLYEWVTCSLSRRSARLISRIDLELLMSMTLFGVRVCSKALRFLITTVD